MTVATLPPADDASEAAPVGSAGIGAPPAGGLARDLVIGGRRFEGNLLLCPIAGYCDLSFRLAIRSVGGPALCYTDLVNPRALLEGSLTAMRLAETSPDERPVGVQLYGCVPDEMAAAAQWVIQREAPDVLDINMGCPVNKVAGKGGGAGLLRTLDNAVAVAAAVVRASEAMPPSPRDGLRTPVTVKMRLGWDDTALVAPELARRLEDVGVSAVTVHGRTAEMKFTGQVRHEGIARVVESVRRIPVIGNGDVDSPAAAEEMIRRTGCAGVMIGRAALSDQWLFREALAHLRRQDAPAPPSRLERLAVMNRHFRHLLARRGEHAALTTFRQRVSWYAGKLAPCPTLRRGMREMESAAQYEDLTGRFADRLRDDPNCHF